MATPCFGHDAPGRPMGFPPAPAPAAFARSGANPSVPPRRQAGVGWCFAMAVPSQNSRTSNPGILPRHHRRPNKSLKPTSLRSRLSSVVRPLSAGARRRRECPPTMRSREAPGSQRPSTMAPSTHAGSPDSMARVRRLPLVTWRSGGVVLTLAWHVRRGATGATTALRYPARRTNLGLGSRAPRVRNGFARFLRRAPSVARPRSSHA